MQGSSIMDILGDISSSAPAAPAPTSSSNDLLDILGGPSSLSSAPAQPNNTGKIQVLVFMF